MNRNDSLRAFYGRSDVRGEIVVNGARARMSERKLVTLVSVSEEEKDISSADNTCKEDTSGGVKKMRFATKRIVSHDNLALATIESDIRHELRKGQSSNRSRDRYRKVDQCPI